MRSSRRRETFMEINNQVEVWTALGIAIIGVYKMVFQVPKDIRENKAESVLIGTIKQLEERVKTLEEENQKLRARLKKLL